jgi:hypothetical protein
MFHGRAYLAKGENKDPEVVRWPVSDLRSMRGHSQFDLCSDASITTKSHSALREEAKNF